MPDGGPVNPGLGLGVATDEIGINLTGTVSKNGTTTLTGVGTAFTTQLSVGQVIRVPGTATEDRIVSAIASDTSLTVSVAFVNTASGQTAQRVVHYQFVKLVDGTADATAVSAFVSGRLDVNIGGASAVPTVSNAETIADNAGFTDGTSKVFPGGYIFDETAGTGLTENDVGAARMDSKRAAISVIEDATTRGRRATVSATGGLLGDQGAPATDANAWYIRGRRLATYGAGYRLAVAAGTIHLGLTFAANTDKQLVSIYHAASATKIVRIRYLSLSVQSGAIGSYMFELRPLSATTAPATGNPAITPSPYDFGDAAAEATCLSLPTTAGSYVNVDRPVGPIFHWNSTTAAATANPSGLSGSEIVLHNSRDAIDRKPLTMPAATACGFGVVGRCSAAVTLGFTVFIEFTEE